MDADLRLLRSFCEPQAPNDTPKQKLSLNLPADITKRIKIEVIERGKGVTEATVVLEALDLYWTLEETRKMMPKLKEQVLANVPLHEIDFGMGLSLEEKISMLKLIRNAMKS